MTIATAEQSSTTRFQDGAGRSTSVRSVGAAGAFVLLRLRGELG
jgi:hypothetical protein